MQLELVRLRKKKKKDKCLYFDCLVTFWLDTFMMLFHATGRVVCHDNMMNGTWL